jgi:hypothetical protein
MVLRPEAEGATGFSLGFQLREPTIPWRRAPKGRQTECDDNTYMECRNTMDQWLALVSVQIICSNKSLEFSQITTTTHSRSDMCEIDPRELSPFRANPFRV